MTTTIKATIQERGNGFPSVGDYVAGYDGEVYRVIKLIGRIQTGSPGSPNTINALVTLADWDDVDDDTEPSCTAAIHDEE